MSNLTVLFRRCSYMNDVAAASGCVCCTLLTTKCPRSFHKIPHLSFKHVCSFSSLACVILIFCVWNKDRVRKNGKEKANDELLNAFPLKLIITSVFLRCPESTRIIINRGTRNSQKAINLNGNYTFKLTDGARKNIYVSKAKR